MLGSHRVLLKVSGEALMGDLPFGVSQEAAASVANKICELHEKGVQIGVVVGGGNICRGIQQGAAWGMERTPADQIGMLATLMNGIALNQALQNAGCEVRMMSALDCPAIVEKYQWTRAMRYFEKGHVVLFVGGTGHPYFTTDTTAALRACEMQADLFLKGTTWVDGVYDKDPRKEADAKKYDRLSFQEVLDKRLKILDPSAVALCRDAAPKPIPIRVFNFYEGSLVDAVNEGTIGTLVT